MKIEVGQYWYYIISKEIWLVVKVENKWCNLERIKKDSKDLDGKRYTTSNNYPISNFDMNWKYLDKKVTKILYDNGKTGNN